MKKSRWLLLLAFFMGILLIIISASIYFWRYLTSPIITQQPITYVLKSGSSIKNLAEDLHRQGYLKHPQIFEVLMRLEGSATKLKAGEYEFPVGSTPIKIIERIVAGKVAYHAFMIVNGWNFTHILASLEQNPYLIHTLQGLSPQQAAAKMQLPYPSIEGVLLPNTYFFTLGTKDTAILQRAFQAQQLFLASAWPQRAANLPYKTAYQALIVASLIEKETALDSERPLIAAVIIKRWQIGMRLEIDPSVIYGLGSLYKGNLTSANLRLPTPYNTYVNYGLPPTPIAMPSIPSIQAALHPAATDALYFVAKGDGSHVFSSTLSQHDAAVKKYVLGK